MTNRNINIACFYASYHVLNSLLPNRNEDWRNMLVHVGLDPDNPSTNTETPEGIGNLAGEGVVAFREHDGTNQLGDYWGRTYNLEPYADYTSFKPVNTAYRLRHPSKWQPRIIAMANGAFHVQQFVTPQYRYVQTLLLRRPQ